MEPLDGADICTRCGYAAGTPHDENYIKPGTILRDRYLIGRLAHKNGEGARYVGCDLQGKRRVWVQEYFPPTLARRDAATGVVLPLGECGAQYKALMSDFVDVCNEVKRLSITEPVIPVEDVLYENNTVCAVYKAMEVLPLELWLKQRGGKLPLEQMQEMFMPLLSMLSNIHGHGQIHRGISPYTVYADRDAGLYLWDFSLGATRTSGSELEAELFNGYSAPEQYSPNGWQGSWTDVYATAALIYRVLSGVTPPKSTIIGEGRPMAPLVDLVMDIPPYISDAIAEATLSSATQRTQTIATLTSRLMQKSELSTAVYDTNKMQKERKNEIRRVRRSGLNTGAAKYAIITLLATVVVLALVIFGVMKAYFPELLGSGSDSDGEESMLTSENAGNGDEEDEPQSGAAAEDNTVPRFVGRRAADVVADARYTGRFEFTVKEEFSDDYAAGEIYDQSPVEGTVVDGKQTIVLLVSKGPEVIELPDLIGLDIEDAIKILDSLEVPYEVFERRSPDAEPNTVLSMIPNPKEELDPKRQTLYIFIAPGQSEPESSQESSRPSSGGSRSESSGGAGNGVISFWDPGNN